MPIPPHRVERWLLDCVKHDQYEAIVKDLNLDQLQHLHKLLRAMHPVDVVNEFWHHHLMPWGGTRFEAKLLDAIERFAQRIETLRAGL